MTQPEYDQSVTRPVPKLTMQRGRSRSGRYSRWVNAPLQNYIREELERRNWSISDLARAIGRAPSLVSRWMTGAIPTPESLNDVANGLGVDPDHLMVLAGYRVETDFDDDPRHAALIAKIRLVELTDERYAYLESLLETMRRRRVTSSDSGS